MAYDSGCEEDVNLRFIFEDLPEDRDEVDSVSKHVIHFESGKVYLPQYFVNSENRGVKKETRRLRTVSEGILKKFDRNIPRHPDGVAALLIFSDKVEDGQVKQLPLVLRDVCDGVIFHVLYHTSHLAIVYMEAKSYTFLGEKIIEGNGFNIQNMIIKDLEALCLDPLPSCLIELLTPGSSGEAIQRELSNVLVTFCGSFKYLRLCEGYEPDQKPTDPCMSLTLLFSKHAQRNAEKLNALLSEENAPWVRYQRPEVARVPFEQLFTLKNHSAPALGVISGNDVPGVRISVMFSSKKDEMMEFYRVLTGKDPVSRSDKMGTNYIIYPIARNLELQLIYNSSIHTHPSSNARICIRIADHKKISVCLPQPLTSNDADQWVTYDPVGNHIRLFTPFE